MADSAQVVTNRTTQRGGLVKNSAGLIVGKFAAMGLGFLFWLVAARHAAATDVGLAAAVVAATLLSVQLAQLGTGQALVLLVWTTDAEHRPTLARLAFRTVGISSVVVCGAAVAIGASTSGTLGSLARNPAGALLFLVATVAGTFGIVQDQLSMAIGQGGQIVSRNVANGGLGLVLLIATTLHRHHPGWETILGTWTLGSIIAVLIGWRHVRVGLHTRAFASQASPPAAELRKRLREVGGRNFALIFLERVPGLLLPLLVVQLLSPGENAVWYTVWQVAWAVFIVPIAVGTGLYADVAALGPDALGRRVRHALRASLMVSTGIGIAAAVAAPLVLPLVGARYSSSGLAPLLVLIAAAAPATIVQVYFALCRSLLAFDEATVLAGSMAFATLVSAFVVARSGGGLVGIAIVWFVCNSLGAAVAGWRLRRLLAAQSSGAVEMAVS
jgi:O-antigen/teichoic acid export membrane protein